MTQISCHIIRDLIPLYVDNVVSEDTKEMVERHLDCCEECKKEVGLMKQEVYLPMEKQVPQIKGLKKKWCIKKLMISGLSVLLTSFILFGAFYYVFHFEKIIPYSESLFQIEVQENDMLVSRYHGESYYSVTATHPITLEMDGVEKRAIFLHYTETIAESRSGELFKGNDTHHDYIFPIDHQDNVDVIFYGDFDASEIFDEGNNWESLLEHAELIWEK